MQHKPLFTLGLTCIALIFGVKARGQFSQIGMETGPGARILFGNEALSNSQRLALGYSFGLKTTYKFNQTLSIKSGIYYELKGGQTPLYSANANDPILQRRGYTTSQNGGIIQFRSRDNFNFISIPILLKINIGEARHWYVQAGGSVGYLFKVQVVNRYKDGETYRINPMDRFFHLEYSAIFGAGYETALNSKWNINFEYRNHIGLNNLLDSPNIIGEGSLQTFSSFFLAGLSYRLGEK